MEFMKYRIMNLKAAFALAALGSVSAGHAFWHESFAGDPYTNLNGGPDNLTIANNNASFAGVEGTYYGRADLLIPEGPKLFPDLVRLRVAIPGTGAVGFGWYSPVHDVAISLLFDAGEDTYSMVEHIGLVNPAPIFTNVWGGAGPTMPELWHNTDGTWGLNGSPGIVTGVSHSDDMHFFIYGWESPTSVHGVIDWAEAQGIPEPGTLVAVGIGIAFLALRRRSR